MLIQNRPADTTSWTNMPTPAPSKNEPAFDIVDSITRNTLESAGKETSWGYSYTEAVTALRNSQTVLAKLPAAASSDQEKASDITALADQAIEFANKQERFDVRGPILLQALDDASILAHGSARRSEKLDDINSIVTAALTRFGQPEWNQACGVAMQALADVRLVSQHKDPAISDSETSCLSITDKNAAATLAQAARLYNASEAGPVLKSGLVNLKATLSAVENPLK